MSESPVIAAARAPSVSPDPVRVAVVDDSGVARNIMGRWIASEPDLKLAACFTSARSALDTLDRADLDVLILDLEMPDIDGLTALPLLLAKKPDLAVIVVSTLTVRNAKASLKALALGALECMPKPCATDAMQDAQAFRHELIEKIRALGTARQRSRPRAIAHVASPPLAPRKPPARGGASKIALREFSAMAPQALVIGSSTGGPQALTTLLRDLHDAIDAHPVLITQHMPRMFTTILAGHIQRTIGRPCAEARDGEDVKPGRIYIAPGAQHMCVARRDNRTIIVLGDGPPVHFCKPAIDPLFESAARVFGARTLGIVLTGMGSDGTVGAGAIVNAGGAIIAQDEPSSVVWGMPGSVANAGLCAAVLPLDDISACIKSLLSGERV